MHGEKQAWPADLILITSTLLIRALWITTEEPASLHMRKFTTEKFQQPKQSDVC